MTGKINKFYHLIAAGILHYLSNYGRRVGPRVSGKRYFWGKVSSGEQGNRATRIVCANQEGKKSWFKIASLAMLVIRLVCGICGTCRGLMDRQGYNNQFCIQKQTPTHRPIGFRWSRKSTGGMHGLVGKIYLNSNESTSIRAPKALLGAKTVRILYDSSSVLPLPWSRRIAWAGKKASRSLQRGCPSPAINFRGVPPGRHSPFTTKNLIPEPRGGVGQLSCDTRRVKPLPITTAASSRVQTSSDFRTSRHLVWGSAVFDVSRKIIHSSISNPAIFRRNNCGILAVWGPTHSAATSISRAKYAHRFLEPKRPQPGIYGPRNCSLAARKRQGHFVSDWFLSKLAQGLDA